MAGFDFAVAYFEFGGFTEDEPVSSRQLSRGRGPKISTPLVRPRM